MLLEAHSIWSYVAVCLKTTSCTNTAQISFPGGQKAANNSKTSDTQIDLSALEAAHLAFSMNKGHSKTMKEQ